ncbi:aminopeptidase P family protein [Helicobacter bizzozeronii]|uniref:aminopeptidase P family protein n=1 Tax=Helicobacter bizzozeronii TaxID=56877 RepID=UPI000CEDAFA9|nr:aminopeptidase P family protein [Helicobacter bizzozeronii]
MAHFTTNESAQYFACGYSCDHAIFLQLEDRAFFITDSRYTLEARAQVQGGVEVVEGSDLWAHMIDLVQKTPPNKLYFDPAQITLQNYQRLEAHLGEKLVGELDYHRKQRVVKTPEQIALLKQSQSLNVRALKEFASCVQSLSEPSEAFLQFKVKEFLTHQGAYDLSFEPIVAINANAAKPHALPDSQTHLKKGDLLLMDMGLKYQRYCSDRTRCALFDGGLDFEKPQRFNDPELQKIYDIVRQAQESTIEQLRAGMTGQQIDAIARGVIEKSGYGRFFGHGTGHGIGLDIHELPFISPRSQMVVEEGMVFSIEPGIYIPGKYGIRIEDLVVVHDSRAQIL